MAPTGRVQVICKEIIKPSSPTPSHLSTFTLSLIDLIVPPVYISIILFFNSKSTSEVELESNHPHSLLKKSLSDTLTHFYTLAGRIKNNLFVDCNDEGVGYVEAKVNCAICEFMNSEVHVLNQLLPHADIISPDMSSVAPLVIQVNMFDCGGIAISVSMSHKISDASSMTNFINTWAAISRGSTEFLTPTFDIQSLFPLRPLPFPVSVTSIENVSVPVISTLVTKKFIFTGLNLAALRAKIAADSLDSKYPTRVEAVLALIWKLLMTKSGPSSKQTSNLFHAVDLRKRMDPPLPKQSFGNAVLMATATAMVSEDSQSFDELVGHIRDGISKINSDYIKKLQGDNEEFIKYIGVLAGLTTEAEAEAEADVYVISSWCRFPLYESDFGWGKPDLVSCTMLELMEIQAVHLMDTRDGEGIEVSLRLKEENMAFLELNEELLAFTIS